MQALLQHRFSAQQSGSFACMRRLHCGVEHSVQAWVRPVRKWTRSCFAMMGCQSKPGMERVARHPSTSTNTSESMSGACTHRGHPLRMCFCLLLPCVLGLHIAHCTLAVSARLPMSAWQRVS